jgi:galactokinase
MPSRQPDPTRVERMMAALARTFPEQADLTAEGSPKAQPAGLTRPRGTELVRAPGQVNLMGAHTDYNDGFVLPVALGLDCWLAFRRRSDGLVRIASCQFEEGGSFWIDDVDPRAAGGAAPAASGPGPGAGSWVDYVAATAWSLRESGLPVHGLDGVIDSNVPIGVGLGSAAALELACAVALAGTDRVVAAPVLAALAQRAEREYVGVDRGIMGQFASAAGREGKALLLDCRSLETKLIAMPHGLRVVVCDTGSRVSPDHATFRDRKAECARAVALLSERIAGLCSLRDLDPSLLKRYRSRLTETLARRAEHVIAENSRVLDAAVALGSADLDELARLFAESHASLRDLFDVGSPAVEAMIQIATSVPGVVASRMTGPGLGGLTVHLVLEDAVPALGAAIRESYTALTGLTAHIYPLATVDGAGRLLGREISPERL